jgi:hypothetical protein
MALVDQHLDFNKIAELRNALVQNLAATTSVTVEGQLAYVAGADHHFWGHNGTAAKKILWSDDLGIIQQTATDLTGGALVKGATWFNTTTNVLKWYDGTTTKTAADTSQVASMFRVRSAAFSAAAGTLPTVASATVLPGVALAQGDTFLATTAGTIVGIGGADKLEPGDMLVLFDASAPTVAASWYAFQTNMDLPANILAYENVTVNLTAGANVTITPLVLTGIQDVEMFDNTGAKRRFIDITHAAGAATAVVNSLNAITGARAFVLGTV